MSEPIYYTRKQVEAMKSDIDQASQRLIRENTDLRAKEPA